jgi:hypothetical protein
MILVALVGLSLFAERTVRSWREYRKKADFHADCERDELRIAAEHEGSVARGRADARKVLNGGKFGTLRDPKARKEVPPEERAPLAERFDTDAQSEAEWAARSHQKALEFGRLRRVFHARWW